MSKAHKNDFREILRSLLIDIESMYEGGEVSGEGRQPEEFFGPFSVWKSDDRGLETYASVSWPNLAISMRNAKRVLENSDGQTSVTDTPAG
jgi:hypothetical protein